MPGIPFLRALLAGRTRAQTPRRKAVLGVEALESRQLLTCNNIISGFVFLDLNNNGLLDTGEPRLANSTIQLRNAQGVVIATTQTDGNGFYQFDHDPTLSTASQTLTRSVTFPETPTDWTQAELIQQFDPSLGKLTGVDIIANAQVKNQQKVESLDNIAQTITSSVSGNLTLNGPGISPLVVNLSASQTFNASAFDGVIDFAGTSGHDFGLQTIPGTKTLTITDPTALAAFTGTGSVSFNAATHITSSDTGSGNLVTQVNTTALANVQIVYHYIPENCLQAGNYTLVQTSQPPGLLEGFESSNGQVIPGSVGTDTIHVTLTEGVPSVHNDFAELPPAGLAGCVFVDQNNNGAKDNGEPGVSSVNITLTGVNDLGQQVTLTQTTDAGGNYQFTGLRPGTYALTEGPVAGFFPGMSTLGSLGGTLSPGQFSHINVAPGANGTNYCFAEVAPGSLSGCVFVDLNNNGVKDSNEPVQPGVVVTLTGVTNSGQQVNVSQTTDANGNYQFTNLQPGTYSLTQSPVAGFSDGKDALGSLGGVVSIGQFTHIVLPANASGTNYCFALVPPGSLSGCVFFDDNNNGVKDNNEVGIPGVTITLTGTNNLGQAVRVVQATDFSGNYSFTGLLPGNYLITETDPQGVVDGKDHIGSLGGSEPVKDQFFVALGAGQNGTDYCFGERQPTIPNVMPTPPGQISKFNLIANNALLAAHVSAAPAVVSANTGVTVTPMVHPAIKPAAKPQPPVFSILPWWWTTHHA